MKYKLAIFLFAFSLTFECANSVERKDPRLRDEDISASLLSVEYFTRSDGLMEYVYSINNPLGNKGILSTLLLDLSCEAKFEYVNLPYANGKEGYMGGVTISTPKHTPAAIHADYGSAASYGITENNAALWGLYHLPGKSITGLRLISSAKPGMRNYSLAPYMDNDASWNYPEEPDPTIPWIHDFTITGMIAGPGCPGVTKPLSKTTRYQGSFYDVKQNDINNLLSYRIPQRDLFHVVSGTKETTLHIFYGKDIDANTFKVEPVWMKKYFNPIAGANELVILPLKKVRNNIKLSVDTIKAKGMIRNDTISPYSYNDTDKFEIRIDDK